MREIILVTGPASSGKSEWAEYKASLMASPIIYVATATIDEQDPEWMARIDKHIKRRPPSWQTLQVPIELTATINLIKPPHCLLIDSLGTWVANLLDLDNYTWQQIVNDFLSCLLSCQVDIILVAEETGWGVVPAYPYGRLFRDRLGNLVRSVGVIASTVYLVTAGYVLNLSLLGESLPNAKSCN